MGRRRGAGEPAAASDGLDEEDVDAGTFSAIFEDSSDEPSAADGPGAAGLDPSLRSQRGVAVDRRSGPRKAALLCL